MGFVEICNDIREIVLDRPPPDIRHTPHCIFDDNVILCRVWVYPSNPTSETVIAAFSETSPGDVCGRYVALSDISQLLDWGCNTHRVFR